MDGKSDTLLKMHMQAKKHGVALNPKLLNKLLEAQESLPEGVTPLPVVSHSSGPAHQVASQEDLQAENIVRLDDRRPASTMRRRWHG